MSYKTQAIPTHKAVGNTIDGFKIVPKSGDEFSDEINAVYEQASRLGGRVVSHEMAELGFLEKREDKEIAPLTGHKAVQHAVLVCEVPHQDDKV